MATWNPDTAEYEDGDDPIDTAAQDDGYLEETAVLATLLAGRMSSKDISPKSFGNELWALIVDAYIVSYLLGRGGLGSMADDDWTALGDGLVGQREFLDNFVKQLSSDDIAEGTIRNRATMYILSSGAMYEYGRHRAKIASGNYSEELWDLGAAEHCPDCQDLNARGWVELGSLPTVPRAGSTQCLSHCKCAIRYR